MRQFLKGALANVALLLTSVSLIYLALRFLTFRVLLPHLSLNLRPHFPDRAEVFAQASKAAYRPRDYVAILGDSCAEGQGDGLLAANGDRAKFYHAADELHRCWRARRRIRLPRFKNPARIDTRGSREGLDGVRCLAFLA